MASMLRLGSKDRPAFFFRKSGQQNVGTGSRPGSEVYDPDTDQLPSISHIDTASLVNLFDRFNRHSPEDSSTTRSQPMQNSTSARDFAWPVGTGMSSAPARKYASFPTNMVIPTVSNVDESMAGMVRNGSTGSSSLSRESDTTPPLTRHSSTSSITPVVTPTTPDTCNRPQEQHTVLPKASNLDSTSRSSIRRQRGSRSRTWDIPSSSGSRRPSQTIPLPVGPPHEESRHSKPVPRSRYRRAESRGITHASRVGNEPVTSPTRFESLSKPSRPASDTCPSSYRQAVTESSAASPPTSRGAKLGRAIAQGSRGPRTRSKSEDLLKSVCQTRKKSYRKSAPGSLVEVPQRLPAPLNALPKPVAANTAENVIYRIMCQLENPQDLQSLALVSKGFLNTYLRNQSRLVSHLAFKTSRSAWELRRTFLSLQSSRTFRLRDYQRDLQTIQALKAVILDSCRSSCKAKTIAGLRGEDEQCEREVENALWRIWTFCALFGKNASQNPVPADEIDWLNGSNGAKSRTIGAGFAVGNGTGLSVDELEDMSEMWCCLQALVSQFHGREAEAQQAGVFDNQLDDTPSAHQHIVEWTSYLLTLGLQVLLSLCSGSFDHAKLVGLTQWTLPPTGESRSGFLMAAISQVYQERLLAEATAMAAQISLPSGPVQRPTRSSPTLNVVASLSPIRLPSLRINTQLHQQKQRPKSVPATVPATNIRPDCDPESAYPSTPRPEQMHTRTVSASAASTLFPASPTADPTIYHTLNLTAPANTASLKLGATLFPIKYTPTTPGVSFVAAPPPPTRVPPPPPARAPPLPPTRVPPPPPVPDPRIVDPVDKALTLLVSELGFKEANAKRALAMCDSGSGIDVDRAIELLMLESRREAMRTAAPVELPTPVDAMSPQFSMVSQQDTVMPLRWTSKKREYCDGACRTPVAVRSGASFAKRQGSVLSREQSKIRHVSSDNRAALRFDEDQENDEEAEGNAGNISPITDIYGGHSDDDIRPYSSLLDDDSSEVWQRREGNDTISPLMPTNANFRPKMNRMSTQTRKAWKVLGAQERGTPEQEQGIHANDSPMGKGLKGSLARMRSNNSSSVVGLSEYTERVERRKSMRVVQATMADRRAVVTVGLAEQLKGFGVGVGRREMRGGLGGFRVVEGVQESQNQSEGMGGMRKRRSVKGFLNGE